MPGLLNISDAASLALHGMAVLAQQPGRMVSTHEIASELNASEAHLAKVLGRLAKCDLAQSVRGPKGGFRLTRPPGEIVLLDIYQAIDQVPPDGQCLFGRALCPDKRCMFRTLLSEVEVLVSGHLAKTTLADLAQTYRSKTHGDTKDCAY